MTCTLCSYHKSSVINCMEGQGPSPCQFFFLGQAPASYEEEFRYPMAGPSGGLFNELLRYAGLSRDMVRVSNAIRCRPPNDKVTGVNELRICRQHLIDELLEVQPSVIVALGAIAHKSLTDSTAGITSSRGRFSVLTEVGGVPLAKPAWLFSMNMPSVVFRRWEDFPIVIEDFKKLGRLIREGFKEGNLGQYETILTVSRAKQIFEYLSQQPRVACDLETTTYKFWDKSEAGWTNILCTSFSAQPGTGFTLPFMGQHCVPVWDHTGQDPERDFNVIWQLLYEFFTGSVPKWFQNGIFDIPFLKANGIPFNLDSFAFDTLLGHHTLQENTAHDLDFLLGLYSDMPLYSKEKEEWAKNNKVKIKSFSQYPNDLLWKYAAADADGTVTVGDELIKELETEFTQHKVNGIWEPMPLKRLCDEIVMPLNRALIRMKYRGIVWDENYAATLQDHEESVRNEHLRQFEEQLKEVRGDGSINLKSAQQVGAALFNSRFPPADANWDGKDAWGKPWKPGFGLPIVKRTEAQKPSSDVEVLEELNKQTGHPAVKALVGTRRVDKKISTYLLGSDRKSGLLKFQVPHTKRTHPDWKQQGTKTGRLSVGDPGIHNLPSGKKEGQEDYAALRYTFTVPDGWWMIQADYSQLELRVVATICNEPAMLDAFARGLDVHKWTASELFGVPYDQVTIGQRKVAKDINFGLIYGKSDYSLAIDMGISLEEAQEFLNMYFTKFSGLNKYFEDSKSDLREKNEIINVFGRKRRLYGYSYLHPSVVEKYAPGNRKFLWQCGLKLNEMERQCVNFGVQSAGHDLMSKYGTIQIDREYAMRGMESGLLMDHHDALYAETPSNELYLATLILVQCMETPAPELDGVAFPVDCEIGPRWGIIDEQVTEQVMTWVRQQPRIVGQAA